MKIVKKLGLLLIIGILMLVCNTQAAYGAIDRLSCPTLDKPTVLADGKGGPTGIWLKSVTICPKPDSADMIYAAIFDVNNHFRLRHSQVKKLIDSKLPPKSDYFKPTIASASDTLLLKDSVYVKTFRKQAYLKAQKQIKNRLSTTAWVFIALGALIVYLLIYMLFFFSIGPINPFASPK